MSTAKVLLPLIGLAFAVPASAATWNTTNNIGLTSGSIYCSTTTCQTTASGLTGSIITMTAYSTPTLQSSTTTSPTDTGNWLNANIAIYGGNGVGISNSPQGATDTSVPQHAIDNNGVDDILVVDFGSNNWDVSSFSLGYTCAMNSTASGCVGSTVNVAAWVGGTSAVNFNTFGGFSGNGAAATLPGFSALTLSPDPGGSGMRTDTTVPNPVGRYLVITGDLARYTDSFKVSGITATQSTPPGGTVPLPGTVPLLGFGLLAMTWASRRRAPASR